MKSYTENTELDFADWAQALILDQFAIFDDIEAGYMNEYTIDPAELEELKGANHGN